MIPPYCKHCNAPLTREEMERYLNACEGIKHKPGPILCWTCVARRIAEFLAAGCEQ